MRATSRADAFMRLLAASLAIVLVSAPLFADQVIMKSGKIYKGRIMGETNKSLLISDPTPRFLPMSEIMTIVRESPPPDVKEVPKRYVSVEAGLGPLFFLSRNLGLNVAPQLHFGGGFRLHPLVQVDGDADWMPAASGDLAIFNGQTLRSYESLSALSGGFGLRVFPFGLRYWSIEPYVQAGYQWTRLAAKGSGGDALKGSLWRCAVGIEGPLSRKLFWDMRLVYSRVRLGEVHFLADDADLNDKIKNDSLGLRLGIARHF
jgi:hypothetical protein